MGQKVNPHGYRVGINKTWDSNWIADKKHIATYILEDNKIREFVENKYKNCNIAKVCIERNNDTSVLISLYTSRPGMVIGQKGAGVETMKASISKLIGGKTVNINVVEIKQPDLNAQLVADSIAQQLDQRVVCRRAMKQAIARCQKAGVKGVKVMVSGRINNAEIARSETLHFGSIPLQTLRADIDYGFAEGTIYGKLGVKVWIYKGEILGKVNLTKQLGGRD
jgi:small subunit ribosomal protein S3